MESRRVRLITHTGCDMPLQEAKSLHIGMVPDKVIFGETEYRNMTEITAEDFYEKMEAARELPTSSGPSVGDFVRAFREAAEDADEILCLMITSRMSGCYSTAVAAAGTVKRQGLKVPVYVYDTQQCSHGMAQMVRAAAKMAEEGDSALQIMEKLSDLQGRMGVYFVLESLKNARKGGRVGAIKAIAADALGIKPLLLFADGLVSDYAIARGMADGMERVASRFFSEGTQEETVTVFHAAAPERAEEMKKIILREVPGAVIRIESVGPVIGIYTGSGCVGIAFTKKD
ncbi:MAG: DegV family protein [Blautia sp.]|nr:DegV family protein [Blautia sp.]MDY3997948.1 DegV family protein [Blautia sp.]